MKITIDLKSALCGLAIGLVAMLLIGAGTSSNSVGRYKIVTGTSDGKGFALILDTQTGQVWCDDQNYRLARSLSASFWMEK